MSREVKRANANMLLSWRDMGRQGALSSGFWRGVG